MQENTIVRQYTQPGRQVSGIIIIYILYVLGSSCILSTWNLLCWHNAFVVLVCVHTDMSANRHSTCSPKHNGKVWVWFWGGASCRVSPFLRCIANVLHSIKQTQSHDTISIEVRKTTHADRHTLVCYIHTLTITQ